MVKIMSKRRSRGSKRLFGYRINHRQTVHHVVPYFWVRVDAETDRIADIGVFLAGDPGGKKSRIGFPT